MSEERATSIPTSRLSDKTIGRLSIYKRMLYTVKSERRPYIFSHQIAALCGVTAAQVRRDLMSIGYSGSPNRGYNTEELLLSIEDLLDDPQGQNVALVGIGNLGRAILAYFSGRRPRLQIVAAFDNDPAKVNRVLSGCRCYPGAAMSEVLKREDIQVAILTVPATAAQAAAEELVQAGVTGILNFAPASLRVPHQVHVEYIDLATSLEKVAFFSRRTRQRRSPQREAGS